MPAALHALAAPQAVFARRRQADARAPPWARVPGSAAPVRLVVSPAPWPARPGRAFRGRIAYLPKSARRLGEELFDKCIGPPCQRWPISLCIGHRQTGEVHQPDGALMDKKTLKLTHACIRGRSGGPPPALFERPRGWPRQSRSRLLCAASCVPDTLAQRRHTGCFKQEWQRDDRVRKGACVNDQSISTPGSSRGCPRAMPRAPRRSPPRASPLAARLSVPASSAHRRCSVPTAPTRR